MNAATAATAPTQADVDAAQLHADALVSAANAASLDADATSADRRTAWAAADAALDTARDLAKARRLTPVLDGPATIHLHTDSVAAVVVRVTAKTVVVRRVATGDSRTVDHVGPFPVNEADGILDQPVGDPERYTFRPSTGRYHGGGDGSIRLTFSRSVRRVDYSY